MYTMMLMPHYTKMLLPQLLLAVLLAAQQLEAAQTNAADYAELTAGLSSVTLPESAAPSPLVLTGPAFAVVANGGLQHVLVAAARWGRGRVVVFGHEAYLEAYPDSQAPGLAALLRNAAAWAAAGNCTAAPPLRLAALSPEDAALAQKLVAFDSGCFELAAAGAPEGGVTAEWLGATADVVFGYSWGGKTAAELAAIRR